MPIQYKFFNSNATATAQPQLLRLSSSQILTVNSSSNPAVLGTLSGTVKAVTILNSFNTDVTFTVDNVDTYRLEVGDRIVQEDLRAAGLHLQSGSVVRAYHNGVAPTSGSARLTFLG